MNRFSGPPCWRGSAAAAFMSARAPAASLRRGTWNNLGLLYGTLQVHCTPSLAVGRLELPAKAEIRLGNRQAIVRTHQADVIE